MTKHLLYLILFFNLSLYGQFDNENKRAPTFHGSSTSLSHNAKLLDIYNKTQLHISSKADSIFIKRMKLKENDSIQFELSYLIDKFGFIVTDSIVINSGVASFDNYIKLLVRSLPKFTPASNFLTNQYCEYKIDILSEFVVKNNRLTIFDSNKLPEVKDLAMPVFESCAKTTADKTECRNCTYQIIGNHLDLSKLDIPSSLNEIKIMINFSIDEKGKVKNVEIPKSPDIKGFKETVLKAFYSLPEFRVPENRPDFLEQKFTLPLTIRGLGNDGDQRRSILPPKHTYRNIHSPY
nr:hypothetical protein [uncultured Flavobacterium sp.]